MAIKTQILETLGDKDIWQIVLTNNKGTEASFLTLGATWQSFVVTNPAGESRNLVLGFDRAEDYANTGFCAGQSIGRVAGRILNGHAEISGKIYHLPINSATNNHHGGPRGSHTHNWDFVTEEGETFTAVTFIYRAEEAVDGFPGDMTISARYQLDDDNRLMVTYTGYDVTADTLFNPTNHVYFNLSDRQDLTTHTFQVPADEILAVDDNLVPTGEKLSVTGTGYDFREDKNLAEAIQETGGIDDTFLVEPSLTRPIAVLTEIETGDKVSVYSDRNALVVYSLNFPEEGAKFAKDKGAENKKHQGLALEAQFPPNAINLPDLADVVLKKDQEASYTIVFHYEAGK